MKTCGKCKKEIKADDKVMYWAVRFDGDGVRFLVDGDGIFGGGVGRSRGVFHKKCYNKILKFAGVRK